MDMQETIRCWTDALLSLKKLQETGVKVRVAVERLREQAPKDLNVQALIGQIMAAEQESLLANCPP